MSDNKIHNGYTEEEWIAFDEKADLFMQGKLTEEEATAFKKAISGNKELRERMLTLSLMYKAMRTVGKKKDTMLIQEMQQMSEASFKQQYAAKTGATTIAASPSRHNRLMYQLYQWAGVAAVIAIMIWGGYRYMQYDNRMDLYRDYYTVYDTETVTRGQSDDTVNELKALFDAIDTSKNLSGTIIKLEQSYSQASRDEYTPYTNYYNDIAWYLALAYLKANDKEQAVSILKELVDENTGNAFAKRAEELLLKIEELL